MLINADVDEELLGYRGEMAPVFDVRGVGNRHMARADEKCALLTGDFDGDGKAEAVMRMKGIGFDTYRIYGVNGFRIRTIELPDADHCPMTGDLDGDGRDEFIDYQALTLASYDIKGKLHEYEGWPSGTLPCACYDLDGDGRDEVIGVSSKYAWTQEMDPKHLPKDVATNFLGQAVTADKDRREMLKPTGGYLNVKTGKWTAFQFPDIDYRGDYFGGLSDEVVAAKLGDNRGMDVVVRPWVGSFVMAFAPDGKLDYYEEFGEGVMDHGTVSRKGRDYIVVQTETKLLIYP
jgi:hypothetical protein